ncbi:MAG: alpha/beta fold hydrolase [Nanoarchaeota archaeon]
MKIRKKTFYTAVIIFFVLAALLTYAIVQNKNKGKYYFKENSFHYPKDRASPVYSISLKEEKDSINIYRINFESRNFLEYKTTIYSLLIVPKDKKDIPGLILLPGGSVTKESEAILGEKIANLGYAVLTLDQRGVGETGGYYLGFEEDYKIFSQGKEPTQHLSVYDALKAYDVLKATKKVDKNNIAIAGESMGGRYAIIAAAIEKRLKGAIVISSSGFHVKDENLPFTPYLLSVDPDNYIDKISPNYVFMIHSANDSIIPISDAKITFDLAKEPKKFFEVNSCAHGYCEEMHDELKEDLKVIFGK